MISATLIGFLLFMISLALDRIPKTTFPKSVIINKNISSIPSIYFHAKTYHQSNQWDQIQDQDQSQNNWEGMRLSWYQVLTIHNRTESFSILRNQMPPKQKDLVIVQDYPLLSIQECLGLSLAPLFHLFEEHRLWSPKPLRYLSLFKNPIKF